VRQKRDYAFATERKAEKCLSSPYIRKKRVPLEGPSAIKFCLFANSTGRRAVVAICPSKTPRVRTMIGRVRNSKNKISLEKSSLDLKGEGIQVRKCRSGHCWEAEPSLEQMQFIDAERTGADFLFPAVKKTRSRSGQEKVWGREGDIGRGN